MAEPRIDDPRWEDPSLLRRDLAAAGLITTPKDGQPELRTFGWQALVALATIADRQGTSYPGLKRVLQQIHETIDE